MKTTKNTPPPVLVASTYTVEMTEDEALVMMALTGSIGTSLGQQIVASAAFAHTRAIMGDGDHNSPLRTVTGALYDSLHKTGLRAHDFS